MSAVTRIERLARKLQESDFERSLRYQKWVSYIEPLVTKKYGVKFSINWRYMVRAEIRNFINEEETKFLKNN